jgi:group II intron reverse transcriptase/maturase
MDIALSSLRFAFQSVKENQGCAGVDRVSIRMFEENEGVNLQVLQDELFRKVYRPYPLMKVLIPKKDEETPRALCIPTVRDRIVQKAVLNLIEPILDKEFEDTSFAYRKGYSVKRAVYRVRSLYEQGYQFVIDADIDDFFDSVDHDILMDKFEKVIDNREIGHLVRLWLKAEIWNGSTLETSPQGIPQGSPMSPVLANLFLDEIDERLSSDGFRYVRYADNYLILGKNPAEARKGLELSEELLDRLHLDLEVESVSTFDKGFTFLGVFFFNDLIMKPFEKPEKAKSTPVFPAPFDINAWRCGTQERR